MAGITIINLVDIKEKNINELKEWILEMNKMQEAGMRKCNYKAFLTIESLRAIVVEELIERGTLIG